MRKAKQFLVGSRHRWNMTVHGMRLVKRAPGANRVFQSLLYEKVAMKREETKETVAELIPSQRVRGGPFEGMLYPSLDSTGSMLAPKLLGTYEAEIAAIFQSTYLSQFDTIVDIGCAEGYYAVGCAVRNPHARVLAYDTSPAAQRLCALMAASNEVGDRIEIRSTCGPEDLIHLASQRALIISDCEGFESRLFSDRVVQSLARHDVLIEVHEHLGAHLPSLRRAFEGSHRVETYVSVPDFEKPSRYQPSSVRELPFSTQLLLLAECRPTTMTWLLARSAS